MTRPRAIAIAIACIEREIKRLAVEANLADQCGATYPAAVQASQRRQELRAAMAALKEPEQQRMRL
jgi:hypothetical protein